MVAGEYTGDIRKTILDEILQDNKSDVSAVNTYLFGGFSGWM
ncbi:MAG: hypothetical protein WAT14_02830 [Chitinophagaceae bacterium]